jgi:hypothetical protein
MASNQSGKGWKMLELAALATGLGGSAAACLANYNWHLFRESVFYMIFAVLPLCWMIGIPLVLTALVVFSLIVENLRR